MTQISAVIVNWNTRDYLARCLEALYAGAQGLSLETWVVDNASSDGSQEMVLQRFPQVRLLENAGNVGFGRANNQALQQAQGETLLLLNSDAFLLPGALPLLYQRLSQHPEAGLTAPQLLYEDGSLQRSCYAFPTLTTELWQTLYLDRVFARSRVFGRYLMTYWDMQDAREVDVVMGACLLLRREALQQVGFFDEQFFMYSEEVDLCYRLHRAGWKARYEPEAQAVHVWGGSSRRVKTETLLRLYRSRVQFFRKHYGGLTAGLYKGVLALNGLTRGLGGLPVGALRRDPDLLEKSRGYLRLVGALGGF